MHLHRSGLYFKKDTGSLVHRRRSCSAFFDAVFIRSSARPDCAGSRPLLAAAATAKRKGRVRRSLSIFLCLALAQFTLGRFHSLPLLTGRGYLYPKNFGNRLRARKGNGQFPQVISRSSTPTSSVIYKKYISSPVGSKTRTHYGPVGSGRRTAGRRGGAGLGRTGRRRVDPARRETSLLPSSESKTLSWTSLREHEQTKSYY